VTEGNGDHRNFQGEVKTLKETSSRQWEEINRIGARVLVIETEFKHVDQTMRDMRQAMTDGFTHIGEKLEKVNNKESADNDRRLAGADRRAATAITIIVMLLMLILGWLGKGSLGV